MLLLCEYLLFSLTTHYCNELKVLEMYRYFSYNQFEMQFIIFHNSANQYRTFFSKQKSLNKFSSDKGNQSIYLLRYSNECNLPYLINLAEVGLISEIRENQAVHTKTIIGP